MFDWLIIGAGFAGAVLAERLARVRGEQAPVRTSRDDRYFTDRFQAMPRDGYTAMFRRILDHRNIEIRLGTEYRELGDGDLCYPVPRPENQALSTFHHIQQALSRDAVGAGRGAGLPAAAGPTV